MVTTTVGGKAIQLIPNAHGKGLQLGAESQRHLAKRTTLPYCPHCEERLLLVHHEVAYDRSEAAYDPYPEYRALASECTLCGFWIARTIGTFNDEWLTPFVASFNPGSEVPALTALIRELRTAGKHDLYSLDPKRFELLVGSILSEFFTCEVRHVGRSGDGGIDLIAVGADNPLLVQVKRRTSVEAVEGIEVVKTMFASMFAARANQGMIVTTAQRFTRGARSWARLPALRELGYEIELVDIRNLLSMVASFEDPPEPAWHEALTAWQGKNRRMPLPGSEKAYSAVHLMDGLLLARHSAEVGEVGDVSEKFLFSIADRDCCWALRTDKDISTHSGDVVEDVMKLARSNDWLVQRVSGGAYTSLLMELPNAAVDALIRMWAGPEEALLVEYEY